ncbi:vWA domain-containing protein [Polyangium jinanense]|uniref:VWA domain-containing protein n=1 Tax=Polyangium jinanense TaxID=2829994 RepID=A0A9X3X3J6_9BACT|nr:VWA domain-containing protein [Polyangium jinanense]MDC3954189.1 VWA domain-containing protein [Polyangium jinanense]MDC3981855.1 VWA domain-containing protein [Polyangium jinanense]
MKRSSFLPFVFPALCAAWIGGIGLGLAACADDSAPGEPTGGDGGSGGKQQDGSGGEPPGGTTTGPGPDEPPPHPDDTLVKIIEAPRPIGCVGVDQSKPTTFFVSADDSNSMASPVHARDLLRLGMEPYPSEIRTHEFLNYYQILYPAAPTGQLTLFPELEAEKDAPEQLYFQVALRSFNAIEPRKPMNITFLVDTSGSMQGPGLTRAKAAVSAIASQLAAGDLVGIVTWGAANNVLLADHVATGPNDPAILAVTDALTASGGTDLKSGLHAGYDLAQKHYAPGRLNRVVLISDGGANVGVTDADRIAMAAEDADKEGIYLLGIATGPALTHNDAIMDTLTDKGRGAYVYLDSTDEATNMFVKRFDETMDIAARSVSVELTLPWYFDMQKFYGEEYATDKTEVAPQHLAPNDAMIFSQVLKTCDPMVVNPSDPVTIRAVWTTPITYAKQTTEVTTTIGELLAAQKMGLPKGRVIVMYAEALKRPGKESLTKAREAALAYDPELADPVIAEIVSLIEKHPQFPAP